MSFYNADSVHFIYFFLYPILIMTCIMLLFQLLCTFSLFVFQSIIFNKIYTENKQLRTQYIQKVELWHRSIKNIKDSVCWCF